jgi:hypothetical protein
MDSADCRARGVIATTVDRDLALAEVKPRAAVKPPRIAARR